MTLLFRKTICLWKQSRKRILKKFQQKSHSSSTRKGRILLSFLYLCKHKKIVLLWDSHSSPQHVKNKVFLHLQKYILLKLYQFYSAKLYNKGYAEAPKPLFTNWRQQNLSRNRKLEKSLPKLFFDMIPLRILILPLLTTMCKDF